MAYDNIIFSLFFMALNQLQQFQELIKQAQRVLICFAAHSHTAGGGVFGADAVAGALALGKFLTKQNKKYEIVCNEFQTPKELDFLADISQIKPKLNNLRQFVINLDLKDKQINEFSYDVKQDEDGSHLEIYVLPEAGIFVPEDVSFNNSDYRFDLIITLDAPDLEALGEIYAAQPEFFFNTPVINIDHNLNNENYGQMNLVSLTKTSVCEIIFSLIKKIDETAFDNQLATALLTGIISKTQSFKAARMSPETLQSASELMTLGADRERIVQNLYRTKTLSVLRLWGRVLARLHYEANLKLVWSSLPQADFVKCGASQDDIRGVVEELIANSPQAEIVLVIYEQTTGGVGGQLHTTVNYDAKYLLNSYSVAGTKNLVTFNLPDKDLKTAENEIIAEIRQKLGG